MTSGNLNMNLKSMSDDQALSDSDWFDIVSARIKERNQCQYQPFREIFGNNSKLFHEVNVLNRQQIETKRLLGILLHDTVALSSSDTAVNIDSLKSKLVQILSQIREKQNDESKERIIRSDLSKRVREQTMLLIHQREELEMAKEERRLLQEHSLVIVYYIYYIYV